MSATAKSGTEHLASLRDGREVYLDGKRVEDVTTHPAFRNACKSAAELYDFQARPENIVLVKLSSIGALSLNRAALERDELAQRLRAHNWRK